MDPTTNSQFNRRRFLGASGRSAAALAVAGVLPASFLAACGSDDDQTSSSSSSSAGGGAIDFQLAWVPDVESGGTFVADDKGMFTDEGLDVTLLPGGPDIAVEPIVQAGKALVGVTTPVFTATAVNKGADLKIIGATFQKNPFSITSLADAPIKSPDEMVGKKIGVAAVNETIWTSFLKVNDISPDQVEKVVIQADPAPLAAGEVDGIVAFYFIEPTYLKAEGVDSYSFSMGDFNLASFGDVYIAKTESLDDPDTRAQLVNVMRASVNGWQGAVDDPEFAAQLAVDKYGKDLDLDLDQQTEQMKLQAKLVAPPETDETGLLFMPDDEIAANIESMAASGTDASADLFTNEILEEASNS